MRNIVIVRGPQGSGKSSLITRLGLDGHALSFDKVRQVVSGDTLNHLGYLIVPQQHDDVVFAITRESLQRRMADGETIVFEATLPENRDVRVIADMARQHRYAVLVVDFYATPIEAAKAANALRPERTRVAETSLERTCKVASTQRLDADLDVVRVGGPSDLASAEDRIMTFLTRGCQVRDLSSYRRIVHVGDLQGTIDPLLDPRSPLHAGLDPQDFHVFTGDLLDRGVDNDAVVRWWLSNAQGKPNVVLIAGNHEDHVELFVDGKPAVSSEWSLKTEPQLAGAGIGADVLRPIVDEALPFLSYDWRGTRVLCTHGGLSRWPAAMHLVPVDVLRGGNGPYGLDIDAAWTAAEGESEDACRRYQVHGHRNTRLVPTRASDLSFNLEAGVEFGGHLRFAVLDETGWHTQDIRSRRFRTMQDEQRFAREIRRKAFSRTAPITPWIERGDEDLVPMNEGTISAFLAHDMVSVAEQETMPHVSSVNFTRSAFYNKAWDRVTTHARGLFINTQDRTIVARSYEKFWNRGEREETQDAALAETVLFPVDGFDKLNGFLGITGYSERTDALVVASKSRVDGTFAVIAQDILREKLGPAGMERLLRFNRDQKASLLFEIIDPVRDPHIIAEPAPRAVLIGCVRRHEIFEQVPYAMLVKIAAWLGCEVKENLFPNIKDWRALASILDRVATSPTWRRDNPTEGIVFQDANGLQFKQKSLFYANWKRMRGAVERLALCRSRNASFDAGHFADMPDFAPFLGWIQTLPDEALGVGIVALRHLWLNDRASAEAMGPAPVTHSAPDLSGFLKGAESILAGIEAGTAKSETVARFLQRAEADADRREALEERGWLEKFRDALAA